MEQLVLAQALVVSERGAEDVRLALGRGALDRNVLDHGLRETVVLGPIPAGMSHEQTKVGGHAHRRVGQDVEAAAGDRELVQLELGHVQEARLRGRDLVPAGELVRLQHAKVPGATGQEAEVDVAVAEHKVAHLGRQVHRVVVQRRERAQAHPRVHRGWLIRLIERNTKPRSPYAAYWSAKPYMLRREIAFATDSAITTGRAATTLPA